MPKHLWRTLLETLLLWSAWVVCVLSIIPVLLGVPGRPDFWEFALYIAVLTAVVGYALALPPILISKRRARISGDGARVIALHRLARVAFILVIAVGSIVFYAVYRNEQSRPVLTREELIVNSFDNAILHKDTRWMERLIAEGASVDHPLSLGQTPAVMSAEFGEWSLVLFLLDKGADPDKKDSGGLSVRALAASPSRPVEKPSEKSALDRVRALLNEK